MPLPKAGSPEQGEGREPLATLPTLPPPRQLLGVQIHPVRLDEMLAWVEQTIEARGQALVMNVNAHALNLAQRDPAFRAALNRADLLFCDGQGVRLAAALLGIPLPARFTPPDWIPTLAAHCARRDYRLFFLGARPGIAEASAERLRRTLPSLHIATHHGYFDPHGAENEAVLRQIRAEDPDILLVGMGMPMQELWMVDNHAAHPARVTFSVGALFDYLSGRTPRGPRWLTDNGLEWLCRLYFEPHRLWRRYLLGNLLFAGYILQARLKRTLHQTHHRHL